MSWRALAVFVALLAVAFVALGWLRLEQLDLTGRQQQIAASVSRLLGRQVEITGGLELGFSLRPAVVAQGVSIANAPWASRPVMLELDRMEIGLGLIPLLFGTWDVSRVVLIGGQLLIETDAEGRGNWELGKRAEERLQDEAERAVTQTPDVVAEEVWVERLRLEVRDGRTRRTARADLRTLELSATDPDAPTAFRLDLVADGFAVRASGRSGGVADLLFDRPFPLEIEAGVGGSTLRAQGHVESMRRLEGLTLELEASGPELNALPGLHDLPDLGAFDLGATLAGAQGRLTLEPMSLRAGESDVAGSIRVQLTTPPQVRARLRSGTIDLAPWLSERAEGPADDGAGAGPPRETRRLFADTPLGLGEISSPPVDAVVEADRLHALGAQLDLAHAELSLDRGKLDLTPLRARFRGASMETNLEIEASTGSPRVAFRLLAQDVDLGELLRRLELTDKLAALVDVGIDVKGSGDSVAAILGGLDGYVALAVSQGRIPTSWVDLAVADLGKLLTSWARPSRTTEIECGVVQLQLKEGVAHTQVLMFDTEHMTLSGKGDIDLRQERIQLDLAPRPRDKRLLSLATDVRLTGSLASPRARPQPVGVANTLVRFVLNPLRILVPFDLLRVGRQHPCIDDVQEIGRGIHEDDSGGGRSG